MKFTLDAGSDIGKARNLIYNIATQDLRIYKEPAPKVVVSETTSTQTTLLVRVWANHEDYWEVFYALQENVKEAFRKEGI